MPQFEYASQRLGPGWPWTAKRRMQDMINRSGVRRLAGPPLPEVERRAHSYFALRARKT